MNADAVSTEQPPIEVGGFARFAEDWKSIRFTNRAGYPDLMQCLDTRSPRSRMTKADRLEAGGFNLEMEIREVHGDLSSKHERNRHQH